MRFVTGYYDYKYWQSHQLQGTLESIEMDHLNLLQWILFFNEHRLLSHYLLESPVGKSIQLLQCLSGDHQPLEYVLTDSKTKEEL